MNQNAQCPNKCTLWLLAAVFASWPLFGAVLVLAFGDCRSGLEYFIYRSIGHVAIVAALVIAAVMSFKTVPIKSARLSRLDAALIAIVVIAFVYSSIFADPNYYLLIPASLILLLSLIGLVSAVALFSRPPGGAPDVIWDAIFISMLLYLPVLPYIMTALPAEPGFHWSSCFAPVQNLRWYGALLAIALAAGLVSNGPGKLPRSAATWWRPLALVMLWTLLFWSGSRGQVLGLLVAVVTLAILSPRHRRPLATRMATTALSGLAISAILPLPSGDFGILPRLISTKGLGQPIEVITSGRSAMWADTVSAIQDRPLLGHGYLQFFSATGEKYNAFHTHSFPLEAILAFGLIGGGALILLILGFYLRQTEKARRAGFPDRIVPPFLVFSTILIMSLVSGGVLFQTISIYFIVSGTAFWVGLASRKEGNLPKTKN